MRKIQGNIFFYIFSVIIIHFLSESSDISIEEDDFLEPWENLIQYLSSTHIEGLHKIFKNQSSSQSSEITPVQLSKDEFVKAIDSVLGKWNNRRQQRSQL